MKKIIHFLLILNLSLVFSQELIIGEETVDPGIVFIFEGAIKDHVIPSGLHSVISSEKFQKSEMELPVAIGKTISNETLVFDLAKNQELMHNSLSLFKLLHKSELC